MVILHKTLFLWIILTSGTFVQACAADMQSRMARPLVGDDEKNRDSSLYVGQTFEGECSYYGSKFHGRETANGEIYNMFGLTAAHRTLPFGTIIEVTNMANDRHVRLRVNDRGPFKKNRLLDVSYKAAELLNMIQQGTTAVKIKIIELPKREDNSG
ncbi:MAG: septal ring lytic transglycosylase RlpA family protein [Caldithrix sp.]|nr:septal ring lytic transglycosylase RlpA family protein [Caldithrix sp.]